MWKQTTISIIFVSLLGACATPYEKAVDYKQLNERVVEIRSAGNARTSRHRVEEYAMLASADICLKRGFSRFSELSNDTSTQRSTVTSSTPSNTTCTGFGASMNCSTTGGVDTSTYTRHSGVVRIYLYKEGEDMPLTAFDCKLIQRQLAPKYKKKN